MKEEKTKSPRRIKRRSGTTDLGEDVPYRKPALRSEAFAKALTDAKACISNPESLQALFNDAARKAAAVSREPFKEDWAYLQTMLRLVRAHHRGEYDQVPDNVFFFSSRRRHTMLTCDWSSDVCSSD